jgi:hypothetical protein
MQYIFFDTNIYRQLGLMTHLNLDYENFVSLVKVKSYKLGLIDIVEEELLDFFKNDILMKALDNYDDAVHNILENSLFIQMRLNVLTNREIVETRAINNYKKYIYQSKKIKLKTIYTKALLDFCIANKRLSKKDNTRDFMIFSTLIYHAQKKKDINFIFITSDNIFYENDFLKNVLISKNVNNLEFIKSIPSYIHKYGYQVEFINLDLIYKSINNKVIEEELLKDITCLPSYINTYYNDNNCVPNLVDYKISVPKIEEYYTYFDRETSKVFLSTSLSAHVMATFDVETDKKILDYQEKNKDQSKPN